eukprot:TRINITY_DN8417_c5_g1_i1.p1 TRINITY_DN8417_c5_g1~~TRINITY_DN8417_c5_g1_i1.p1  ORF type:complete len:686 (+),score=137.15 TRINITY_DN8417_c5_g1_i1:64-2058(+)
MAEAEAAAAQPPAEAAPAAAPAQQQQSAAASYRARRRRMQAAKQRGPFVRDTASDSELPDRVRCLAYRLLCDQLSELVLPAHYLLEFRKLVDGLLLDLQQGDLDPQLCLSAADLDEAVRGTRWWSLPKVENWLRPEVVSWSQPVLARLLRERGVASLYQPPQPDTGPAPVRRFVEVSSASIRGARQHQEDCVGTCAHWGNYYLGSNALQCPPHALLEVDERQLYPALCSSGAHRRSSSFTGAPAPASPKGSRGHSWSGGSTSPRGGRRKRPNQARSASPVTGDRTGQQQQQQQQPTAVDRWKRSAQYFFVVADGHGGTEAAVYARDMLLPHLLRSHHFPLDLSAAWRQAFAVTHTAFLSRADMVECDAGTTMLCALVWGTRLHFAWAGDSEAFLSREGRVMPLTSPHRPDNEDERRRVEEKGGRVRSVGGNLRVDGVVGVTRAIGGRTCAMHLSHEPETGSVEITPDDDFAVLATDGVWDVLSPQEVLEFVAAERAAVDDRVREVLRARKSRRASCSTEEPGSRRGSQAAGDGDVPTGSGTWDYGKIAEKLCCEAVKRKSSDNCSALIAFFNHPVLDAAPAPAASRRPSRRRQTTSGSPAHTDLDGSPSAASLLWPAGAPPVHLGSAASTPQSPTMTPPQRSMQSRVADLQKIYSSSPRSRGRH